jgi:hypothetical protein
MNISQNNTTTAIIDRVFEVYGDDRTPMVIITSPKGDPFSYIHLPFSPTNIQVLNTVASCILDGTNLQFFSYVHRYDKTFDLKDPDSLLGIYEYVMELHRHMVRSAKSPMDHINIREFVIFKFRKFIANILSLFKRK